MKLENIQIDILTERPSVRNDQPSELDIVIEIRTKQSADTTKNAKHLNLCVVIDRSGSMDGDKVEAAKKGCIDIYRQLNPDDLFTVVVFNDEAEVIVNPQTPKAEVIDKINNIRAVGNTNLSLGWYLGLLELQTYMTENHNSRLFLLSDGQANKGETKKATLAQEAFKSRELGISTSTIGIGDDFQEDILEAIARESGGRFYYIVESKIEDIIEEEFKGALSVAIDRPRIELKLPAHGVIVSKELNAIKKSHGKYCPRPIKGEDLFNFAIRLEITPEIISEDSFVLEVTLSDGSKNILTTQKIVLLQSVEGWVLADSNSIVKSVVQQYETTVANEGVIEKLSEGSFDLMKKMLVVEIGGMHKVKDALEVQRSQERDKEDFGRFEHESNYFARELLDKETSFLFAEIFENFSQATEVHNFVMRWRKLLHHEQSRNSNRSNNRSNSDDDIQMSLLENAVELVELLMQRFPDKADELKNHKEKLNEQLARYK
jgi:Mg-chelatase subunit ChlD